MTTQAQRRPVQAYVTADCLATDVVKNCVYITGDKVSGRFQVATVNPRDATKRPAYGIIVRKITSTRCVVQTGGAMEDVYTDRTPNKPQFVGINGQLTEDPSTITALAGGKVFVQPFGTALASDTVEVVPGTPIIRLP